LFEELTFCCSYSACDSEWGFKTSGLKLNGRYVYYTFSHELFQRDQPDLCCSMQRVGMKAWKDGRSKRNHKGAEPETKPNHDDKTAELQNLQMNFAPPMHSVQPMFVPILQPVIFPPMEQFFMANQYPMFPVIPEMNPPPQPREVNRQAPKSKIQASKPQPRVSPRQSPKPTPIKEPCPEVKDDAEKSKISLTQDEVIAIIGITMLDGKN
jgi:hypothetical protein